MAEKLIRIGCSGWMYRDWRGRFYPENLPQKKWLEHYASRFDTVEVNNSFYRLPEEGTFSAWEGRVPDDFLFALKASRYLTHIKRLKEPEEPLNRFWGRARLLKSKRGPVLYQLPTRWARDEKRFFDFLEALPDEPFQVVEFRDPSWYTDAVFDAMARRGVALCLHDMTGSAPLREVVGPFLYLRFHGTEAKYRGGYPDATLQNWAKWAAPHARSGKAVYAYFNNDVAGHAVRDASNLRDRLGLLIRTEAA